MSSVPQAKKKAADITSFFEIEKAEAQEKENIEKTSVEASVEDRLAISILNHIKAKGKISKSELYKWSKKRGISPAELYRSLQALMSKGLVKRAFDPDTEEIVYIAS